MVLATELLLIRHGESQANIGLTTHLDSCLTPRGIDQARQLGIRLAAGHDLRDFVGLTSPYQRARQTAAEISGATGIAFEIEEHVREWSDAATVNGRHFPKEIGEELVARLETFLEIHSGRKLII